MFGVQAARMLVRALENAGTDDPLKVNAAFRALKFEPGAMEIVLPIIPGRMSFDNNGMVEGTTPIFVQWKDGKKQIVYPEAVASAKPIIHGRK